MNEDIRTLQRGRDAQHVLLGQPPDPPSPAGGYRPKPPMPVRSMARKLNVVLTH